MSIVDSFLLCELVQTLEFVPLIDLSFRAVPQNKRWILDKNDKTFKIQQAHSTSIHNIYE